VKSPHWDNPQGRGYIGPQADFAARRGPRVVGDEIDAKWRGKSVHMKVIQVLDNGQYACEILFFPDLLDQTLGPLSVGDTVAVNHSHIDWFFGKDAE